MCGILFNRHKWKYIDNHNRVCGKCGECQHYASSAMWGNFWAPLGPEQFVSVMKMDKRFRKTNEKYRDEIEEMLKR